MDKKAKKILFKTYWTGKGWIDDPYTPSEDFLYAKEKGLMFEPLTISHDVLVNKIITISSKIKEEEVGRAFLSSLTTRRLD